MKFLSVRKGATGSHSRPLNIGENEFALASAVKEVVTRWRSSSPNKKKGGPLPKVYKRTSPQARKLSSLTGKK